MDTREGRIVTLVYEEEEEVNIPVQSMLHSYTLGHSWVSEQEEKELLEEEIDNEIKTNIVKKVRMDDGYVKLVGWLDITEGRIPGGRPITKPLEEGEDVIIAAKVKQVDKMDTMMSKCELWEKENKLKTLTDEKGCILDDEMIENIHTKYNKATKVKE